MSSPTFVGAPHFKWAVPFVESPVGWQTTPSCWPLGLPAGVLPLLKITTRSPLGMVMGSEPWLKSHALGERRLSKKLPKKHNDDDEPLISSGVDHVRPWLVDMEP